MRYLERRVLHATFLMIAASVLCFLFTDLAPGTFFDEMKLNPQISSETVAALRSQYGLNRPLPLRYLDWLKSVFRGQWGYSFAYNSPVRGLLTTRARNTLVLTTSAVVLAWLLALPLGLWSAAHPEGWMDRLCVGSTSALLAIPEIVLVLGLLCFAMHSHLLPVGGMVSPQFGDLAFWAKLEDLGMHAVIPVAALVLAGLPQLIRHVRSSMMRALGAPFVQAARGHGISTLRRLVRYALPAAASPLISLFGLSFGGLLSGSLLVEAVTGWPGLGPLLLEATLARDMYVVVDVVMLSTTFMIAGNLLADLMLVAVDPRTRTA